MKTGKIVRIRNGFYKGFRGRILGPVAGDKTAVWVQIYCIGLRLQFPIKDLEVK